MKDTAHLSLLEHGVYSRLLDVYYTREGAIPVAQVERLIGVRSKDEKAAIANVLQEFFSVDGDVLRHSRCEWEIARYQKKAVHNREVGKLGGRPRKSETQTVPNQEPTNNPGGFQTEPTNNPPQTPVTSNQTPVTSKDRKPAQAPVFVLPDWVNRQHWDVWHSTPKRKRATSEQKQMAVDKLDEWRLAGLDYATALENAAIGGNQGLFLPTTPRAGQPNKQQALEDRNLAVARQWVEDSHAIQ